MSLWQNGCCIQSDMLSYEALENPQLIERWRNRIIEKNNFGIPCTGKILSIEEQNTKDQKQAAINEAKKQADLADQERRRREYLEAESKIKAIEADIQGKIAARRTNASSYLRTFSKDDLCEAIGTAIRDSTVDTIGNYPELSRLVQAEARRRGYSFSVELVKSQKVRIGMTECELYASLGFPDKQNRTVSQSGEHIQHVYSSMEAYFYTRNGRLTSWQD